MTLVREAKGEIFCGILARESAAILGVQFCSIRRKEILRRAGRRSSAGRVESDTMVRFDGRLAQRLERPAYTGKVRGSNP